MPGLVNDEMYEEVDGSTSTLIKGKRVRDSMKTAKQLILFLKYLLYVLSNANAFQNVNMVISSI